MKTPITLCFIKELLAIIASITMLLPFSVVADIITFDPSTSRVNIIGTAASDAVEITEFDETQIRVTVSNGTTIESKLFASDNVGLIFFFGDAGDDSIKNLTAIRLKAFGGEGNDIITGGDNTDYLSGGPGDDLLNGGAGADYILGDDDNDTIVGGDGSDLIYCGAGNDQASGSEGNDVILGGTGDDSLIGAAGDDILFGNEGHDTLVGGTGADNIDGGIGNDSIYGEDGIDFLRGGSDNDELWGGADDDIVYGMEGDDILRGQEGHDFLDGGLGSDILSGDEGNDVLSGGDGDDGLDGGSESDQLLGGSGADTLVGGSGRDWLTGDDDNDYLFGGLGMDSLRGSAGNDKLRGDLDDDLLDGGTGENTITNTRQATPFSTVVNPILHGAESTPEKIQVAYEKALSMGNQISIFWNFRKLDALDDRLRMIRIAKDLNLQTFVQVQVQLVGEPTPPEGYTPSFSDPDVRALFLEQVTLIAQESPEIINLSPEVNFLYYFNIITLCSI